jgi:hypothetical protein
VSERQRLAKADQLIAHGNRCLARQKIRIAEMERRGEDTRIAQEMLQALKEARTQIRWHRWLIRIPVVALFDKGPMRITTAALQPAWLHHGTYVQPML